jgi:hypothetical protein
MEIKTPATIGPGEFFPVVGVGPHEKPWPTGDHYDPELLENGDRRNVLDKYRYWSVEAIVADLNTKRHGLQIAIENWQHDLNIGSVVRTANAFNVSAVHIVGKLWLQIDISPWYIIHQSLISPTGVQKITYQLSESTMFLHLSILKVLHFLKSACSFLAKKVLVCQMRALQFVKCSMQLNNMVRHVL